jgi:hypothetical protein
MALEMGNSCSKCFLNKPHIGGRQTVFDREGLARPASRGFRRAEVLDFGDESLAK